RLASVDAWAHPPRARRRRRARRLARALPARPLAGGSPSAWSSALVALGRQCAPAGPGLKPAPTPNRRIKAAPARYTRHAPEKAGRSPVAATRREESPGSTGQGAGEHPGGETPRTSATDSRPPSARAVRVKRRGKGSPAARGTAAGSQAPPRATANREDRRRRTS